MNQEDIHTLSMILDRSEHSDVGDLLNGCYGEVEESTQYGSYWNSILSTYLIYAPIEKYLFLKEISDSARQVLYEAVLDLYPHGEGLPEITDVEFRVLRDSQIPTNDQAEKEITIRDKILIFISYSTKDKALAGRLKAQLERLKLTVFLAHEDIEPSLEWQIVILKKLDESDAYVPIITSNFHQSAWTDQEAGIALAKRKLMIPIAVDDNMPYGFVSRYQAHKTTSRYIEESSEKIIRVLLNKAELRNLMFQPVLNLLRQSNTYDQAGERAELLLRLGELSSDQLNQVLNVAVDNNQIYPSFKVQDVMKHLFKNNPVKPDKVLIEQINSLIGEPVFEEWE